MCSRPITRDGNTFGCGSCNECIGNRKHQWIARAMAEKLEWRHTLCLALTYDPKLSLENRDARAIFVYEDVRLFVKRLASGARRYAKRHKLGIKPRVKFLAAGEQGSKGDNHCHWHMIIYSDLDLTLLGKFEGMKDGKKQVLTKREDLLTVGETKKRLNWTFWGKGFVTLQEPDQGGVAYVVSYVLKDQFTEEKSRETMRVGRSENFATGLFRMSKRPPIGWTWVMRKMGRLAAAGAVLPDLNMTIPGMTGYWHPQGSMRRKILESLVAINDRVVRATGANAPQWSSLLQSLKDNPADLEILNGSQEDEEDADEFAREIALRGREYENRREIAAHGRRCGASVPCHDCLQYYAINQPEVLAGIGVEEYFEETGYSAGLNFRSLDGWPSLETRQKASGGGINPLCRQAGSEISHKTFPRSDPRPAGKGGSQMSSG